MRQRIFRNMSLLIVLVLLSVSALASVFLYRVYYNAKVSEVQLEAEMLSVTLNHFALSDKTEYLEHVGSLSDMRITLIEDSGTVVFDSGADETSMENHGNRPEIVDARKYGQASDVKLSDTLGEQTFYYAVCLDTGDIVRVAYTASSFFAYWIRFVVIALLALVVLMFVALLLAKKMTSSIIEPINNIDLQNPNIQFEYNELNPLLQRMQDYNATVLQNEQMRKEFSGNVSHELKTPLTSISGYAELIMNGLVKQDDIPQFASKIHTESGRMLALVEDIMKLSGLDEKRVGLDKENVDLYVLAKSLEERLLLVAEKYKVLLQVKGSSVVVQGIPMMLEEVMYNLATNALKYNHPGGYAILTVCEQDGHPVIQMEDNGIGISKDHQERIFERFYRVDKSRSKQTGGTGLGLAIVKHAVEYHGGRIELQSEEGRGTTILVFL